MLASLKSVRATDDEVTDDGEIEDEVSAATSDKWTPDVASVVTDERGELAATDEDASFTDANKEATSAG